MPTAKWTNKGLFRCLEIMRGTYNPANFFAALVTDATAPTVDTNTFGQLTEIAAGNGYTSGGISIARNSTDFPVITENDALGLALLRVKNLVWTASGGAIPASGSPARSVVLLGPNAVIANREVLAYWTEDAGFTVPSGQTLTVLNCEIQLKQPA